MVSEYDGYNFPKLPKEELIKKDRKVNKGLNIYEKMGIALLLTWACFTIIFGLMYFNDGFKPTVTQNVTCSDIPSCPVAPACPECQEQTCECNFPELNLTCNYPPIEVNWTI